MDWTTIITASITGLLGGGVASLFAPWIHWGIEQNKGKIGRRIALINNSRTVLNEPGYDGFAFLNHRLFYQLHPHLSETFKENIEEAASREYADFVVKQKAGKKIIHDLKLEINKLEVRWKLI